MTDKEHKEQTKAADDDAPADPAAQTVTGKAGPELDAFDPLADTEALLNGLIVECRYAMRHIAIPAALKTRDAYVGERFLSLAMDVAKAGAVVGKTIAMLRASSHATEGGILEHAGKILPAIAKNG